MKRSILHILTTAVLLLALASCRKNNTPVNQPGDTETPSVATGIVRPIGQSAGAAISKEIGSAGGSIQTPDGTLSLSVPAGALTANTMVGIEPVNNTNPAGIGKTFRLTPHGLQFAKPVDIRFSYADLKDSIAMQESLGLAYQDSTGVWRFMGYHSLDTSAKTIVYKTSHFSDWGLMPWLTLSPYYKILSEDEELQIEAKRYIPFNGCNCPDDDLIVPLVDRGYPVGDPQPMDKKYIKEWKLNGPGFLIAGTNNFADYKAPSGIPITYTTAVSLRLNSKIPRLLVCNITLVSKDVFEWRFNNGPWLKEEAKLVSLGTKRVGIAFVQGDRTLSMNWPTGALTFSWGNEDAYGAFNFFPDGPSRCYYSFYKKDDVNYTSGGGISITQFGKAGEYCAGSFILSPAGFITTSNGKQISTAVIEGRFKLKRY